MKRIVKTLLFAICSANAVTVLAGNLFPSEKFNAESGWTVWVKKPVVTDNGGFAKLENGKAIVKSPAYDDQVNVNIQLIGKVNVAAGKRYQLKFKVNSDKAGKVFINYGLFGVPHTTYVSGMTDIEPGKKEYSVTFDIKPEQELGNAYGSPRAVRFILGELEDASLTIYDVSLDEVK